MHLYVRRIKYAQRRIHHIVHFLKIALVCLRCYCFSILFLKYTLYQTVNEIGSVLVTPRNEFVASASKR